MNIHRFPRLWLRGATAGWALCLLVPAAYAAYAQPSTESAKRPSVTVQHMVDRIVAVVNDEIITQRALDAFTEQARRRLQQAGAPIPEAAQLRAQALEQRILMQIQLQKAREEGLRVKDRERAAALDRLAQAHGMSSEAYRAQLEHQGIRWSTVEQEIEQELLLAHLREEEIDRRIVVSDAEVEDYLTHTDLPEIVQTHARHILLQVSDRRPAARARQQLWAVKKKVEAGRDFADFARQLSNDGTAAQGGDLGWLSPGETVPEFERAMASLKEGAVSMPVRSAYGVHLIQVLERRQVERSTQQKYAIVRQMMGMRKAARAYADWLRALRDSAYVQYMTPEFS